MNFDRLRARLAERRTGAAIAAALGALVYANATGLHFSYDDLVIIQDNDALHSWSRLVASIAQPYWPSHYALEVGVWRPVITLWWGLQWLLFGNHPAVFHTIGVLLHGAVSGLLVLVLAELLPGLAATLAGIVFALHPVHVEAVANVVGNAEVLATALGLAACLLHLRAAPDGRYGWGRSVAVGALFGLAALTKEIAYTLPGVLFLLDAAREELGPRELRGYIGRRWRPYVALVVVMAALLLARMQVLQGVATPQIPAGGDLLRDISRVWTVPAIWPHYVRLMLFPLDLNADYGGIIPVEIGWRAANVAGLLIGLTFLVLAWWAWRTGAPLAPGRSSRRVLGFAVVWFGITVLPAANIVFLSPVLVAERNLYLPSVGAAAAIGWLLMELLERRRDTGLAAALAVVVLMAARTLTRTPLWDDTAALFDDLLERHPEAARPWYFYGDRLFKQGRQQEARRAFAILLQQYDSDYTMSAEVGIRLSAMDRASPRAAAFLLERAWREEPGFYTAPGYLAAHYLNHEQYREGEAPARAAIMLAPENVDLVHILAGLLSGQGRLQEAIAYRWQEIQAAPAQAWRPWVALSEDQLAAGDSSGARAALDSARVRAPSADITAALDARVAEVFGDAHAAPGHQPHISNQP
jgi:tetratricopeptide (TPR) repeat protein